jgi:hypothetical protein
MKSLPLFWNTSKMAGGDQAQLTNNPWKLVVQWCVVAAQQDPKGDSLVSFSVEAITEGDDAYLANGWRID